MAIVVALAASAMPSAALADGSYDFQSDQAHVVAHAKTTDGKNAYYFVFNFPSAVTAATTSNQARCQISNDPKVVKCFVSATGATGPSLDAMFTLANPMTCSDTIGLESSVDGQTYRPDGTLAFSGNCNPHPQPNPEPGPGPAPQPTPDEQPAGGPVSHPRNPIVVGAGAGGGPHVRLFEPPALSSFFQFDAFAPGFTGGVRVAAGDVNGDGLTDVIVGAGPGGGPNVKVYDGKTGSLLQSFFAFDPSVMGGVLVAAGDVNGDGRADIIVAPDSGGGPVVKVFNGADLSVLQSFFAFDSGFTGGVRVAAGDVNGDGRSDIVVGAGPGGGPNVKVFSGSDGSTLRSLFAFDPTLHGGVFVAAGDVNGDGFADLVAGAGGGGGPKVRVFNGKTLASLSSFFAYAPSFTGGVRVATGDVNGDGTPDLITGAGPGSAPAVRVFDGATSTLLHSFNAFDAGFTGGVYPAGANEPTGAGLSSSSFPLIGGGTTLNPSCPAGMPGGFCSGRITLLLPAVQKIRGVKAAARKKAKPVVLGSAKFKVAAGKKGKSRIALSKRALKALGRAKKVKAIARLVTRDAGGNASTRQKAIVLTRDP